MRCTCVPALLAVLLLTACDPELGDGYQPAHRLNGEAMGSYYRITYLGEAVPDLQTTVDSLLDAYNLELSAWVPQSTLNAFNRSASGIALGGTLHFRPNLRVAAEVFEATGGAYDPTVSPLVKFWGFGGAEQRTTALVDSLELDSVRARVGFGLIELTADSLRKRRPGVELDLNASAKGYGVDLISRLLDSLGREDHLVDVGGEMRAGGTKNGKPWTVGIRLPEENATQITAAGTLPLQKGRAIATSGNYLNYYEVAGEKYSHTINPRTGLVERNALLSASVIADDCATADAYATACMVVGPAAALRLVQGNEALEGYFLIGGADGALEVVSTLD